MTRSSIAEALMKNPRYAEQIRAATAEGIRAAAKRNKYKAEPVVVKGGDPSEWPEDLRVREFPNDKAGQETPAGPAAAPGADAGNHPRARPETR